MSSENEILAVDPVRAAEEAAVAARYAEFGIIPETCRKIARLMAHEDRLTAFCDQMDFDLLDAARKIDILPDGTIVHHGSLFVSKQVSALVPNLHVEGVLNLRKYNSSVTEIPVGVRAFGFVPNAATAHQAQGVKPLPYPKEETVSQVSAAPIRAA